MKRNSFLPVFLFFALFPAISHAQYMEPGDGLTPFFEPHRFGWVHEGGLGAAYLTGEGRDNYVGGGGGYYTGLFRPQPSLAFGIHVAAGGMDLGTAYEVNQSINYGLVAGEGRVYIPAGMLDFWGSVVLGGGRLDKVTPDPNGGYEEVSEVLTGTVLGFGAGGDFYLTPTLSVGAHLRMYRLYPREEEQTGDVSNAQFVGMWMTVGVNAAWHF